MIDEARAGRDARGRVPRIGVKLVLSREATDERVHALVALYESERRHYQQSLG